MTKAGEIINRMELMEQRSYTKEELIEYVQKYTGWPRNEALRAHRRIYPELVKKLILKYKVNTDEYTDKYNPNVK